MEMHETEPSGLVKLFSTHPPTESRIEKVQETIEEILPSRNRYVLTTSEFLDVKDRLRDYLNTRPEEEEDNRPSLRRRTRAEDDRSDSEEISEVDDRPRIERRDDDPDRVPEDDDRPVLRRNPD